MATPEQSETIISFLPQWLIDISSICSILGLIISVLVLFDTEK